MLDLKTDGHVHTSRCHHAVGSMDQYVRAAIAQGLARIIFLEHLEVGINYFEKTWLERPDFDDYFEEGLLLQRRHRDEIQIDLGVEVGYNPQCPQEIRQFISEYPFDQVGISYHFMAAEGRHHNLVSRRTSNLEALGRLGVENVVRRYFDTILEAVKTIEGNVVCHLDAVMRYHPDTVITDENHRQIEEILKEMAQRGLALEVNASGCRMRNEPFPARRIIRRALARHIPLIAGSDAHRPEDVGRIGMLAGFIDA